MLSFWMTSAAANKPVSVPSAGGELWVWGSNSSGQLGLGDTTNRSTPEQVGSGSDWATVSLSDSYTLAIKTDGSLWSWGSNSSGQLGLGDTTNRSSPEQVGSDTDWLLVSAGNGATTHAIKTDGSLWGWGNNGNYGVGSGGAANVKSPVLLMSGSLFKKIVKLSLTTFLVSQSNEMFAVGTNNQGQMFNNTSWGSAKNEFTPLTGSYSDDWLSFPDSQGGSGAMIDADGDLWSWGDNTRGQLGVGDTTKREVMTQVSGSDYREVAKGGSFGLAIKTNGELWIWGGNSSGQLGVGGSSHQLSPVQLSWSGSADSQVYAASDASLVWTPSSGIIGWGSNSNSVLGAGSGIQKTPIEIVDWTDIQSISVGGNSVAVIRTPE